MSVDPRFTQALLDDEAVAAARVLTSLVGRPDALVVLGSGLADALDEAWGAPAVTVPLGEIPGVKNVDVILNSGATSKVTVLTDTPLDDAALSDAVSEAGFTLVGISRDF